MNCNICAICDKSFTDNTSMSKHLQECHMKDGMYVCNKCNKLLTTKWNVLRHIKKVHKVILGYKAEKRKNFDRSLGIQGRHAFGGDGINHMEKKLLDINSISNSEQGVTASDIRSNNAQGEKQTLVETSYVCKTCKQNFYCKKDLQVHVFSHSGYYECYKCKQRFGSKAKRDKPLQNNCEQLKKFHSCHQCKKIFKYDFDLQRHKVTMHPSVEIVRGDSDEYTTTKCEITQRKTDINISTPSTESKQIVDGGRCKPSDNKTGNVCTEMGYTKHHYCDVCDKAFVMRYNLVKHKMIHSSSESQNVYKCKVCGMKVSSIKQLWRHEFIHTDKGGYKCSICGYNFKYEYHFKRHLQVHERNISKYCKLCQRLFKKDDCFKKHLKFCKYRARLRNRTKPLKGNSVLQEKKHSADRGFTCDLCGKIFKLESSFHDHKNTHRDHLCFTCSECGDKFKTKTKLKSHSCSNVGNKHLQETNYTSQTFSCNICGRCFKSQLSLSCHSVTHRDHLLYRCNVCSHGFSTRTKLNAHKVTHTDNTVMDTGETSELELMDRYSEEDDDDDDSGDDDDDDKFKKHVCVICKKSMTELDGSWETDHTHVMVLMQ